ncbi:MAG: cation transporter [Cyclobacteriaceae bacterium]|nr:cation transporter [Cyclobacteriaceae bacterium]
MGHDHGHTHGPRILTGVSTAFSIGIWLNFLFVVVEAVVGFRIQSMSLLSDAAHNLADVGTLVLSLVAFRLLKVKANEHYTYGYRKTSILVALFNSVILLVSIGAIAFEAVQKALYPQPLPGSTIAIVAGIGVLVNGTTAFFFLREKDKDINIKSAYLHLLSDTLVSAAIVAGGIAIVYTGWYWVDSALSLLVVGVILVSTWRLLRESLKLSLDGVPNNISVKDITERALRYDGVVGLHHVHIWALSSTENALTAHLVLCKDVSHDRERTIKEQFRHELLHQQIQHITLETEWENEPCEAEDCP